MTTTMANTMASHDSSVLSSRDAQKQHELQALVHVMQNASGIEIEGHVERWFRKESITSVTDLSMMVDEDMEATGWSLTL